MKCRPLNGGGTEDRASVGSPVVLTTLPLRPTIVATSAIWPCAAATPGSLRISAISDVGMLAGAFVAEVMSWRLVTTTSAPLAAPVKS
jgi:hypothetical protein